MCYLSRPMSTKKRVCLRCGKDHHKNRRYCSHTCRLKSEKSTQVKQCEHCNNTFFAQASKSKLKRTKYCCVACKIFAGKKIPSAQQSKVSRGEGGGGKRGNPGQSKDERLSVILLQKLGFDIIPQDRAVLNGLEIDIWFPRFQLGIELNGPVHYFPIYGERRFLQAQRSDTEKRRRAAEVDILILTVDVSTSSAKENLTRFLLGFLLEFQGREAD